MTTPPPKRLPRGLRTPSDADRELLMMLELLIIAREQVIAECHESGVELRDPNGALTIAETADILGVSPSKVYTLQKRALRKMRARSRVLEGPRAASTDR